MFILLVGPPASGKSSWAEQYVEEHNNTVIVSSDAIREELWGDASQQCAPSKVFELAHKRIIEALETGADTIFDATNMLYKYRVNIMEKIKHIDCIKRCVIFAEPYKILCERNAARERRVPEDVIWRMITRFQMPLFSEGYDEIEIINKNQLNMLKHITRMAGFPQDNPRHTKALLSHCTLAANYIYDHRPSTKEYCLVGEAALVHDIGKLFTKTFVDHRGCPSKVAHYYGHENVGSYLTLMFENNWTVYKRLIVAQLVCYHMIPYQTASEAAQERWKARLEDLYDLILLLHEADKQAH